MLRSLFSGISGLRAHQQLMDVVSNNIANVNTTGFKSSSVLFEDTLSQTLKSANSPTGTAGGVNPAQVGLGVQLGAINTNFGQGSAQTTGKTTDLMIQGDGFFVTKGNSGTAYTRSGAFTFDTNGKLVTAEGAAVQGWPKVEGVVVVNTDGAVGDITVASGAMMKPTASGTITVGGNITPAPGTNADGITFPTPMTLSPTVYDPQGVAHTLLVTVKADPANLLVGAAKYTIDITEPPDTTSIIGAGIAAFAADGSYDAVNSTAPSVLLTSAISPPIAFDMTKLTQYGGPKSLSVTATDGSAAGTLESFQIGSDGTLLGVYSNEQKVPLAKLALANFNNPGGLSKIGGTSFAATTNSGLPQVGTAGSGGRGTLLGGTLEMSNVDLAQEFTNLIIAQRGFQANSKVITTSDQMLQDVVDLKR